jgi:hypothetical protein
MPTPTHILNFYAYHLPQQFTIQTYRFQQFTIFYTYHKNHYIPISYQNNFKTISQPRQYYPQIHKFHSYYDFIQFIQFNTI